MFPHDPTFERMSKTFNRVASVGLIISSPSVAAQEVFPAGEVVRLRDGHRELGADGPASTGPEEERREVDPVAAAAGLVPDQQLRTTSLRRGEKASSSFFWGGADPGLFYVFENGTLYNR